MRAYRQTGLETTLRTPMTWMSRDKNSDAVSVRTSDL